MSDITLVLPHALPIPEFAPDLVRALQAPALAALLSRTRAHARTAASDTVRALPHELWLARALGLDEDGRPAFAAAAMRARGLEAQAGTWFIVNPAHIEIARTHLMMGDPDALVLDEAESRALFETALPAFEELGYALVYGDAHTWFMRADAWRELDMATLDSAVGMDLTDWMPLGAQAAAFRRLQNEVQILWHTHPVNATRERERRPPVNAFWAWGGAATGRGRGTTTRLVTLDAPAWLDMLADARPTSPADALPAALGAASGTATGAHSVLVCGSAGRHARAADWGGWVAQMQQLETELFVPILDALTRRRIRALTLVLGHRETLAEFTTNALAQRAFWRRPTLDRLL